MLSLMGVCISAVKKRQEPNKKVTLVTVGLDNAGKTCTTKGLQGENIDDVAPTVGFSSVSFMFDKFDITMYDLGGGKKIRGIWKNYFAEVHGAVFVVDSSDAERIEECKVVLKEMLENPRISGKPILILANKQDKEGALDEIDICENLNLEELVNVNKCPCRVETCSAVMSGKKRLDKSIRAGFQWLISAIVSDYTSLSQRVERESAVQREAEEREKQERLERVRKAREERERQENEFISKNFDDSKKNESDDEVVMSNPFVPLDQNKTDLKKKKSKKKSKKVKSNKSESQEKDDNQGTQLEIQNHIPNQHYNEKEVNHDNEDNKSPSSHQSFKGSWSDKKSPLITEESANEDKEVKKDTSADNEENGDFVPKKKKKKRKRFKRFNKTAPLSLSDSESKIPSLQGPLPALRSTVGALGHLEPISAPPPESYGAAKWTLAEKLEPLRPLTITDETEVAT